MTDIEHVRVSVALKMVRGALGLSQTKFADWVGTSKSTIARIERGTLPITWSLLNTIVQKANDYGIIVTMGDIPRVELTQEYMNIQLNMMSECDD